MGSVTASRLGEVLGGVHKLVELVSTQSAVELYRAKHTQTRVDVRIRLLRPEFALQGPVVDGFLKTPKAVSKLTHDCLPKVTVETDDTGIPFVIEELVKGRPLVELLASFPQGLPLGLATHLLLPLTEALALAHDQNIVHGAIEPSRLVLVGDETTPTAKLLQLGATSEELGLQDDAYRAPELTSRAASSKAADVFALGVLLYRMLSGELPFGAKKDRSIPLDDVAPQLPASWVKLSGECLEIKPGKRIADARTLLQRLQTCAAERGPSQLGFAAIPKLAAARPSPVPVRPSPMPARPSPVPARVSSVPAPRQPVDDFANSTTERPPPSAADKAAADVSLEDTAPGAEERAEPQAASRFAALDETAADYGFDVQDSVPPSKEPEVTKPKSDPAPASAVAAAAVPKERSSEPDQISTLSAVADAFGPLSEEGDEERESSSTKKKKKKKKSEAKSVGDKLGSKISGGKAAGKSEPKRESNPEPRASEATQPKGAMGAALQMSAPRRDSGSQTVDKAAGRPNTKQGQGRSQGQIAAIALTETQLAAMRALRTKSTESRDRWLGLIFMLLFMFLLQAGVPLLYEPKMVHAQELFGRKLNVFAGAFAVVAVIGSVRIWASQIQGGSIIMRVTNYTMQFVTLCICVMTASLFSRSPSLGMLVGAARSGMPWGMSFLFFMFAFTGVMRGARDIGQNIMYGALVIMLSTGSLYGSYRAVFSTVLAGKKLTAAQMAAAQKARMQDARDFSVEGVKKQVGDKTSMTDWQEQHQDVNTMKERHGAGESEEDDLKASDELKNTRTQNAETLDKLQKAMPGNAPQ